MVSKDSRAISLNSGSVERQLLMSKHVSHAVSFCKQNLGHNSLILFFKQTNVRVPTRAQKPPEKYINEIHNCILIVISVKSIYMGLYPRKVEQRLNCNIKKDISRFPQMTNHKISDNFTR